nr:hypothetical protein CKG001_10380 [Bdellovibrio sp. CKG001]
MSRAVSYIEKSIVMESTVIVRDVNPVFGKPNQRCATLKLLSQDRTGWAFVTYETSGLFVSYSFQDEITGHVAEIPWETLTEKQQTFICECISQAMEFSNTPVNRVAPKVREALSKIEKKYGGSNA